MLDNKQMVHVAAEVVVLVGLTMYFSSKNRKLLSHIEDLSLRLEEQEAIIRKHDREISQIASFLQQNKPVDPGSPPAISETPLRSLSPPGEEEARRKALEREQDGERRRLALQARAAQRAQLNNQSSSGILLPTQRSRLSPDLGATEQLYDSGSESEDLDSELQDELGELEKQEDESPGLPEASPGVLPGASPEASPKLVPVKLGDGAEVEEHQLNDELDGN